MITTMNNENIMTRWRQVVFSGDRPVYRLGLLILLIAAGLGCLSAFTLSGTVYTLLKNLQLVCMLGLGGWVARQRGRSMMVLVKTGSDGRLLFTVTLAAMIFVTLLSAYLVLNSQQAFMAAASTAAFILPTVIVSQFETLGSLPDQHFAPWRLPALNEPRKAVIALNSQTVRLKVARSYFDPQDLTITVMQPSREKIGRVFMRALEQQAAVSKDEIMRLDDEDGKPYFWEFFRVNEVLGGKTFLDPEKTLIENGIRDNAVLTAKRIRQ